MNQILLIRYGEIILKGLNRPFFESKLVRNIRNAIADLGDFRFDRSQGRIFVIPKDDDFDIDDAIERITKVFGVVGVSIVQKTPCDMPQIKDEALKMAKDLIQRKGYKTFKVETKRGDKRFPLTSPEISREVGAHLLINTGSLKVDVHNPDFIVYVEIRENAYIYSDKIPGVGGMPTGTNGKAMLLLSGGIDSPVAGYMIGKRGAQLEAIHYYSYPYTSERAKDKVLELARKLSEYCFNLKVHIIPFTDIQLAMRDNCPHEELTIIMRRTMMEIAQRVAEESECLALVTGESVGQVASQTMESLVCTDAAVTMPVFRPLIGMDKEEVIDIARKIDTFDTSILPYEDCCTVFVAKHPKTKPVLEYIIESEKKLDIKDMVEKAIDEREILIFRNGKKIDYRRS